jgi:hypothetical protein
MKLIYLDSDKIKGKSSWLNEKYRELWYIDDIYTGKDREYSPGDIVAGFKHDGEFVSYPEFEFLKKNQKRLKKLWKIFFLQVKKKLQILLKS